MQFLNTFPAKVIDNDDPLIKGRVKIRVEHLFVGVKDSDLPWAYPMNSNLGGSAKHGSSFIPEKDSMIWVAIENMDLLDPIFYISSFMWDDLSNSIFQTFEATDGNKIGLSSQYPDVKFIKLKNGVTVGLSSNDTSPEIFMYHPKGSSLKFAKDGTITAKDSLGTVSIVIEDNTIRINASSSASIRTKGEWKHTGDLQVTGNVVAVDKASNTSVNLFNHQHPTSVPGPPSPPTGVPTSVVNEVPSLDPLTIYPPKIAKLIIDPDTGLIDEEKEEELDMYNSQDNTPGETLA